MKLSWPLKIALAVIFAVSTGCDDTSVTSGESVRLRVLHASPDAPVLDVLIDGLLAFSGISFGSATDYVSLGEGARRIRASESGDPASIIDVRYTLLDNKQYSFVVADYAANIKAWLVEDEDVSTDVGKFKVRLLHAAPGAGALDIYMGDQDQNLRSAEPQKSNVPFGGITNYFGLNEGEYRTRITPHGARAPLIDTGPVRFFARQIRTIVAIDAPGGGTPFRAILMQDRNT